MTGGTGFVGSQLTKFFAQQNHSIIILSRQKLAATKSTRYIKSTKELSAEEKIDIIINMAGSPIDRRWTDSYKKTLINSRLETTKEIISLIGSLKHKPELFISASAIGYYGSRNDSYLDETSEYIDDFTHELCAQWEKEALKAEEYGVRTCIARLGVVLSQDGGALKKMLPAFKFGLGGNIGAGEQFFSWIHIKDVLSAFNFFVINKEQKGIYNLTSPNPITNKEFTKQLSKELNRPAFFHLPYFLVKLIFGEMGESLLLNGAYIYPKKLLDNNFKFQYETIEYALKNILSE